MRPITSAGPVSSIEQASPQATAQSRLALFGTFIGMMSLAATTCLIPFGIYLTSMTKEFGWTRVDFSFGFSVVALVGALLTPVGGWLLDRFGSRAIIMAGTIMLPIAIASFGLLPPSYPLYLAACAFLGVVSAVSAPSTFLTIPPQWFDRNLGLCLAIGSVGFSVGATVMPFLTGQFVAAGGWRNAWFSMAALVAVLGIGNALLCIRDNPEISKVRRSRNTDLLPGVDFADTLKSVPFWLLVITYFCVAVVYTSITFHIAPLMTDRGFSSQQAAAALSLVGLASIAARLATGYCLDRVPYLVVGVVIFVSMAAGLLTLAYGHAPATPYIAAVLLGVGVGGESDLMPYVLRRLFGLRAFGRTFGLAYGVFQLGPLVGPLMMGYVFVHTESYQLALLGLVGAAVLSLVLLVLAASWKGKQVAA